MLFYNTATGFVIPLNPARYELGYCLDVVQEQLSRLLIEHGLGKKIQYLHHLFIVVYLCRNNDKSLVAYMIQSKNLIIIG
jgi:hypothetical protein